MPSQSAQQSEDFAVVGLPQTFKLLDELHDEEGVAIQRVVGQRGPQLGEPALVQERSDFVSEGSLQKSASIPYRSALHLRSRGADWKRISRA